MNLNLKTYLLIALMVSSCFALDYSNTRNGSNKFNEVGKASLNDSIFLIQPQKPIDPLKGWKDLAVIVAVFSGIASIFFTGINIGLSSSQKKIENRWKQANLARELIDKIHSTELSNNALIMIDWEGKNYRKPDGKSSQQIFYAEVIRALNMKTGFDSNDDAIYIRDAFDALFEKLGELERHIDSSLISIDDIEEVFQYYFNKLKMSDNIGMLNALQKFLRDYNYPSTLRFFDRFIKNNS